MNSKLMLTAAAAIIGGCASAADCTVASPDGNIVYAIGTDAQGAPVYSISFDGQTVIAPSTLGLVADEFRLDKGLSMEQLSTASVDETWQPVWGEFADVRNNYNEALFGFTSAEAPARKVNVRVRVYNDGVGFRYEMPEQEAINYITLRDELTQFNLPADMTVYAIPGDYDSDEFLYTIAPLSELPEKMPNPRHSESSRIPGLAAQTPMLMKHPDTGVLVNIHEAALAGYPAMALDIDAQAKSLKSHLTPDKLGVRAYLQAPFVTPWRAVIITADGPDMLASQLIYNLNEPSRIEDTSWITPQKFMGVWWEMFTGGKTWAYSDKYNAKPGITDYDALASNGRHPANNENVKKYIDFAAESGIPAVLVEGWNEGWEDWAGYKKNRQFLFTKPYPDFDLDMLQAYAKERGVRLIMHHETAGNAADYERQLDEALQYMNDHGYNAVKTGYVGHIIPRSEYHSSQWMVDHYLNVAQKAADHKIMVNSHEAVRPTGMMRTYPNWVAQESARGGEYESFGGNPPYHTTMLPFTRLKGGPMDYTPGLFETDLSTYGQGNKSKGLTTIARQLALYLTMPSPLQMACDLPENYRRFADAFQFIKDVPVEWKDSKYLEAEPGEYITVARLDKNSDDWYVGGITNENAREAVVDFSFLPKGSRWTATIYEDGPDAHYKTNTQSYHIYEKQVKGGNKLKVRLAPGGGFAMRLQPVK